MKYALTSGIRVVNATYDKEFGILRYKIGKGHFKITTYKDSEIELCEFSEKEAVKKFNQMRQREIKKAEKVLAGIPKLQEQARKKLHTAMGRKPVMKKEG